MSTHGPAANPLGGLGAEALLGEEARCRVELHVRPVESLTSLEEPAGLTDVGRERAAALALQQLDVVGTGCGHQGLAVGEVVEHHHVVILQPLPHREVRDDGDRERVQLVLGSDAREQQEVSRAVRTR